MLQIVEDAERVGALADIERDILLGELRKSYVEVKFGDAEPEAQPVTPVAPIVAAEESDDEPEVEVELIFNEGEEENENGEVATESKMAEEPAVEEKPAVESVPEEPAVAEELPAESVPEEPDAAEELPAESVPEEPTVEEEPAVEEELSALHTPSPAKKAILSLYDDAPTPVLGEQFHEAPSIADVISAPKGVADMASIESLRSAIGVADKFMIVRELFGGDTEAYDKAINALEAQPSFDDCIIYISENYAWSPNSDGTKLLMELLNRKYN